MPGHSRRRFIIDRVQIRLLVGNCVYLLSVSLFLVIAGIVPLIRTLDDVRLSAEQRDSAARQVLSLNEGLWIVLGLIVALCVIHSVLVSHRIAGPLYRVKHSLGQLAAGDLSVRVRTRRADYLVREVACINRAIESLDRNMGAVEKQHREAGRTLLHLRQTLDQQDLAGARSLCGEFETQFESLGRCIRQFHTTESTLPAPQVPRLDPKPVEPAPV